MFILSQRGSCIIDSSMNIKNLYKEGIFYAKFADSCLQSALISLWILLQYLCIYLISKWDFGPRLFTFYQIRTLWLNLNNTLCARRFCAFCFDSINWREISFWIDTARWCIWNYGGKSWYVKRLGQKFELEVKNIEKYCIFKNFLLI